MIEMKKVLLTLGLLVVVLLSAAKVLAQTTEPGANLPLLPDDSTSQTAVASATAYAAYTTATTSPVYTTSATSATQTAVDDAETGSEVIFLSILSITGGIGIFLIKKYFDFKRYSL